MHWLHQQKRLNWKEEIIEVNDSAHDQAFLKSNFELQVFTNSKHAFIPATESL